EMQAPMSRGRDGDRIEFSEVFRQTGAADIEVELAEIRSCASLESQLQFLVELAGKRVDRILARLDRAAEQAPMARIPDVRTIVASLQEILALDEDDRRDGI